MVHTVLGVHARACALLQTWLQICQEEHNACEMACRYATHVHEALTGLVGDPEQEVRRLMAVQFHDICKMLGKDRCAQYMKRYPPTLLTLLKSPGPAYPSSPCLPLPALFTLPPPAECYSHPSLPCLPFPTPSSPFFTLLCPADLAFPSLPFSSFLTLPDPSIIWTCHFVKVTVLQELYWLMLGHWLALINSVLLGE